MTMVKVRQDAWSHEDDLLLAETVLRHIREGSTQLKAFDEVGDKLNRTSAACGFRWNAEIRQKYVSAIDMAKRQRKEKKRAEAQMEKQAVAAKVEQRPFSSAPAGTFAFEFAEESFTKQHHEPETEQLDLGKVICYLQSLHAANANPSKTAQYTEKLQEENEQLTTEIETLKQELADTNRQLLSVQEDYSTFIKLMERAKQMSFRDVERPDEPVLHQTGSPSLDELIENSN